MFKFKTAPFPNPMAPSSEKTKPEFGVKVAKAILGASASYIEKRNKKFDKWRMFAEGRQPVQPYLNQLTSDGKTAWQNIRYKPRAIVHSFEELVVNGYMETREFPKATAMSKHIADRRERRKNEAQYRMENQEMIQALSMEAGIPLEDPNAFTPESPEELSIWWDMNDQEREEILMQRMLTFTAEDVDLDTLKYRALSEQFQLGLHGFYDYLDNNGRLKTDFIRGEDCIYDTSYQEQLTKEGSYHGRFMRMTISDVRARWGVSRDDEKRLFKLALKYQGINGNPKHTLNWTSRYMDYDERPYDPYIVDILHIWWKCSKVIGFVEGKDRYNREVFDLVADEIPERSKSNGKKKGGAIIPQTAYEGYFVYADDPMCLEWKESRNILRKGYDREVVESPFTFYMTGNKGGMDPKSPVDMIIDHVEMMDLAILKIKTILAQSAPPGYAIDLDALESLDLGQGVGEVEPMTLADIHRNTGILYYRSRKEDGVTPNNTAPILPLSNDISGQITAQMSIYNFELNNVRTTLGINEFRDGSKADARISYRFAAQQVQASNMATHGMYRAWFKTGENIIRHWGIRIWDSLAYGDPNKGYLEFLGKADSDFLKEREDLTKSSYDIKFELAMTQSEKEVLETNLNTAISAGSLEVADAVKVREHDDLRLANRVLAYLTEKRRKQRIEEANQNAERAAAANAQAGQVVEQEKQNTYRIQVQGEREKEQLRKDGDIAIQVVKSGMEVIMESFKSGKEIPQELIPLIDMTYQLAGVKAGKEIDTTQRELQTREQQDIVEEIERGLQAGEITQDQASELASQL
jgi:hypothetical protein